MPYFDENGSEVKDVMTPEEVNEVLANKDKEMQDTLEEAQTIQQEEIQKLQEQIEKEKEERMELELKESNFSMLRKKTAEKDVKILELEKKVDDFKSNFVSQIDKFNQVLSEKSIKETAMEVANGDRELAGKVSFFYKQFSGVPKDEKESKERFQNALVLATGGKSNIMSGSVYSGAGASGDVPVQMGSKWTDEQKNDAKNLFGITEQDIAKYGGKMPKYGSDGISDKEWLNK